MSKSIDQTNTKRKNHQDIQKVWPPELSKQYLPSRWHYNKARHEIAGQRSLAETEMVHVRECELQTRFSDTFNFFWRKCQSHSLNEIIQALSFSRRRRRRRTQESAFIVSLTLSLSLMTMTTMTRISWLVTR